MIPRHWALAALVASTLAFRAAAADPAPALTDGTAAVLRLDLRQVEPLARLIDRPGASDLLLPLGRELAAERATELLVLLDGGNLAAPLLLAAAPGPGGDPGKVGATLARALKQQQAGPVGSAPIRSFVVAGRPAVLARLAAEAPVARPDLIAALAAGDPAAPLRVVVSPGGPLRRALAECLPDLPAELGGGSSAALTTGMTWAALELHPDLRQVRGTIQADTPASAEALARVAGHGLEAATRAVTRDRAIALLAPLLARSRPVVDGNRVDLRLDPAVVVRLVAVPIDEAHRALERAKSTNNLKTFGVTLHNYHREHGSLPPAFTTDAAGRPLLSWRVLILPYIEEDKLFRQFRLDEPWDGPTNRPLIARMPAVFASPVLPPGLAAEGKTGYLAPRGPETISPGATGVGFKDVRDGLANTIMVLEAPADRATTWTKPDDWDAAAIPAALAAGEWAAIMGDGSAFRCQAGRPVDLLHALLTIRGGEVIDFEKLR